MQRPCHSCRPQAPPQVLWRSLPPNTKLRNLEEKPFAIVSGSMVHIPGVRNKTSDALLYPFQHFAADFFHHQGNTYLVLVDKYTNWPVVTPSREGASGLVQTLRETISTFGIPDTLTSDGSPEFSSHTTTRFLVNWGVHHRTASAYHPHANCRAKVAVKTIKRLLAGNTGPGGALTDRFHKALLQAPTRKLECLPQPAYLDDPCAISSLESPTDTIRTQNGPTALTYENELCPNDPCQTVTAGTNIPRDSPPSSAGTLSWYKTRQVATPTNGI